MASKGAITRLKKEYVAFAKDPPPFIQAAMDEKNLLHWDYVLEGPPDSPYHGGWYYGRLKFPKDYPFKPPEILMITPSGRFETNTPLCLSMSSFHPESWNPMWTVGTVLTGLLSFMLETTPTTGAIETSEQFKRQCARDSLTFNLQQPAFPRSFPRMKAIAAAATPPTAAAGPAEARVGAEAATDLMAAAEAAAARGDPAEAVRCCTVALQQSLEGPQKARCLQMRAAARLATADWPRALQDSDAALAAAPGAVAHRLAARGCLPLGRLAECRAHLDSAKEAADSESTSNDVTDRLLEAEAAVTAWQQLSSKEGDARALLAALEKALALCPASAEWQREKAEMLLRLGEFEQAVAVLEAVQGDGREAALKRCKQVRGVMEKKNRGNLAFGQADWRAAARAYTEALAVMPSAVLHANYAAVLQRQERFAQAIEQCTYALRWDPCHQKALGRRAACHLSLQQPQPAVEDYRQLCQLAPDNEEYRRLLQEAERRALDP
eukprot:EG_transcript_7990